MASKSLAFNDMLESSKKSEICNPKSKINTYLCRPKIVLKGILLYWESW